MATRRVKKEDTWVVTLYSMLGAAVLSLPGVLIYGARNTEGAAVQTDNWPIGACVGMCVCLESIRLILWYPMFTHLLNHLIIQADPHPSQTACSW
jgi:hypothetical protein